MSQDIKMRYFMEANCQVITLIVGISLNILNGFQKAYTILSPSYLRRIMLIAAGSSF